MGAAATIGGAAGAAEFIRYPKGPSRDSFKAFRV